MEPTSTLFVLATAASVFAAVAHALWRYGAKLGGNLVLVLVVLIVWQQAIFSPAPYVFLVPTPRPFGLPLGVIAGWLIAALLAIEFSQRLASSLPAALQNRMPFRCASIALYTWGFAHALEPIGQLSGWWRWTAPECQYEFPYFADYRWATNLILLSAPAFPIASWLTTLPLRDLIRSRRGVAVMSIATFLVCVSIHVLGLGHAAILDTLGLQVWAVLSRRWTVQNGFHPRAKPLTTGAWQATLPSVASALIFGTIVHYALATGHDEALRYLAPFLVMIAVPEVWELLGNLRRGGVVEIAPRAVRERSAEIPLLHESGGW